MFDVEAVKLAARSNGFEVIDVEPKPSWQESEAGVWTLEIDIDLPNKGSNEM